MSLSAMIRKRQTGNAATATPATFATLEGEKVRTVASVATVAVANPETPQTDTSKPCSQWLIHFIDRDDLPVLFVPPVDHAGALACYPDAVAAAPMAESFICMATEAAPDEPADDRRTCRQCQHLQGRVCSVAKPGDLVSANRGYQPNPDTMQRCANYLPNASSDSNEQLGLEV